jgi:exodeoxyribonuclease I
MRIHFYDLLTAGRSPAEGQVVRFHSALYGADEECQERLLSVRLRDDVGVPIKGIENSPLSMLNLGGGIDETQFARAVAPLFELPACLHVGVGTTTKLDPYVRHAIYRSLIPNRCITHNPNSHHLDLDTLYRAMILLRPDDLPKQIRGKASMLDQDFNAMMWDADWDQDNRALWVRDLLSAAQQSSPHLVEHAFSKSSIAAIKSSLGMDQGEVSDLTVVRPAFFAHQSIMSRTGFALLFPLATDINFPDIAYMADLASDLSALVDDDNRSLESLVRKTPDDGLPIVRVSLSRMPFVAPLKNIRAEDACRLKINGDFLRANVQLLRNSPHLAARFRDEPILELPSLSADVDHRMWAGEFSQSDLQLMAKLQSQELADWLGLVQGAQDLRISELAVRVIAREQPILLDAEQLSAWKRHVKARVQLAAPSSVEAQLQALQNVFSDCPAAIGIEHLLKRLNGVAAYG